ncbi:hypothetical protein UWK_03228 [Desulfocapsa sulfexigens DSM 10523]|uniref:Uncharacterized protein n=1 Tax=Desulfocapsa sulfexigens (strain DSM 10523 / SB164P1) TaxID=1167006 RepID=M1PJL8_DESSD|nr:hypothetical protein [Desulfocapsa sulfexigens]AGF79755.1 hypothetical protein UWK_03228 [Desulfocapsa sulfexigens DSM 10523]
MGIALLIVVTIYLLAGAIVLYLVKRWTKSKAVVWLGVLLLIFGPFWRPILCNLLFEYYGKQPLQVIHQTVEAPISVYWQDNVWPGFDKHFRESMVEKYLDGVHLQALAVNGDDGKIYLYRADASTFAESEKMRPARDQKKRELDAMKESAREVRRKGGKGLDNRELWRTIREIEKNSTEFGAYYEPWKSELQSIMDRAEGFASPDKLPPMRYRVDFNMVKTGYPASRLLHTDEITITDMEKNEVIAFSRRYMAYGNWLSEFGGANPDFHQVLGDKQAYQFVDKILFGSIDVYGSRQGRNNSLLKILSKKYHENRR